MKTNNLDSSYASIYKEKGLKGVLKLLEAKSTQSLYLGGLIKFDRKHFVVLRFLDHIAEIEAGIRKYGADVQMSKLDEKFGLKLEIFNSFENGNMDRRKGLLIYGVNHPAVIEAFIPLTFLKQKRIKIVGDIMYYHLGKNLRKIIIPVAPRKSTFEANNIVLRKLNPLVRFNNAEIINNDHRRQNNLKTLKKSAEALEKGGVVLIFPGGAGDERTKWRGGLSRIIMNISKSKRENITLVPVYFSGLGSFRMLARLYKAYRGMKLKSQRVGIYFGREKKLSEFYNMFGNKVTENKILEYLKKDAFSQFGLKKFPMHNYLFPKHYPRAASHGLKFALRILIQVFSIRGLIRG